MIQALWRKIEDKIMYKVINREQEKYEPKKYSWADVQYAIQLTVKEMRKKK